MFGSSTNADFKSELFFALSGFVSTRSRSLKLREHDTVFQLLAVPLQCGGVCDKSSEVSRHDAGLTSRHSEHMEFSASIILSKISDTMESSMANSVIRLLFCFPFEQA